MPGRSILWRLLFILQQVMETFLAAKRGLHIGFVEVKKAYDTAPRSNVWEAM